MEVVSSLKPLKKLTGTGRQTGGQAQAQDYVLSQADALTKNIYIESYFGMY